MRELGRAIQEALDWSNLPSVTSTILLQEIKKSVLEEVQAGHLLRTVDELYQRFLQTSNVSKPEAGLRQQFETVLGRLQAQGVLRWLSFGNLIPLQSERLDAYASALLIAVRNEPDGLGIVSEELVRRGQFPIPKEDSISNPVQEQLLLLAMIEELVRHGLVRHEGGFLLFPSQSTREHPEQADLSKRFSGIFSIAGPVLSMYTTLVVPLAHSGIFQKQELWQHVVTYTTQLGGSFSLMLLPRGEDQANLGLFFDAAAREEMRFHFENFVQQHLEPILLPDAPQEPAPPPAPAASDGSRARANTPYSVWRRHHRGTQIRWIHEQALPAGQADPASPAHQPLYEVQTNALAAESEDPRSLADSLYFRQLPSKFPSDGIT